LARKLLVATQNKGKVTEFAGMLSDLELDWLSLADLNTSQDIAETGHSFRENAIIKAQAYARLTGYLTLADDSGLEVDALQGRPGIYTARYGGPGLSHAQRYHLLLRELKDIPWPERSARFRAVIALVAADGSLLGTAEGVCEGVIALEPAGDGGFGYDPVFYLPDRGQTMAQVGSAVKHQISHRGRAMKSIEPLLRRVLSD
jgi:XTP/dITP diphosphohydrolase